MVLAIPGGEVSGAAFSLGSGFRCPMDQAIAVMDPATRNKFPRIVPEKRIGGDDGRSATRLAFRQIENLGMAEATLTCGRGPRMATMFIPDAPNSLVKE